MTLAHASSTASSSLAVSAASNPACCAVEPTNSRMSARFSVEEGTCSMNLRSIRSTYLFLPRRGFAETTFRALDVRAEVVERLEPENLEGLFDLLAEAADFNVAALVPDLLDESHEDAEAGAGDVGQLLAVNDDSALTRVDGGLHRRLELR